MLKLQNAKSRRIVLCLIPYRKILISGQSLNFSFLFKGTFSRDIERYFTASRIKSVLSAWLLVVS
jgi:hypothetical protein